MDDAQWALYRGAYVSGMNLFAPTEMLLYSEGFRGRFVRVPYTWVQEVHLIIPKPKRAWEWAYGDRLKIVYDDGGRHSVGLFIPSADHPAVIAARIAAVNQLEVKREEEQETGEPDVLLEEGRTLKAPTRPPERRPCWHFLRMPTGAADT